MRFFLTLIACFYAMASFASPEELERVERILLQSASAMELVDADRQGILERVCSLLWSASLSSNEVEDLMAWSKTHPELAIIRRVWARHQVEQERIDAWRGERPEFGAWMLENELAGLIQPKREDRILFVGSGPLPSAMLMHEMTTAKIALCDCDAEALEISRRLIRKKGWVSRFEFVHRSVHEIDDVSQYTLIWIATMVPYKYRALDALAKTVSRETKVIVRQATGTKQLFILPYEDLSGHARFSPQWSIETLRCESLLLQAR